MTWPDYISIAKVRALEEADEPNSVWSADARRSATHEAAVKARGSPQRFLLKRSEELTGELRAKPLLSSMRAPGVPSWIIGCIWLVALILGGFLAGIGQEREINLLSLPLIGILIWNITVMILSIISALSKPGPAPEPSWISRLLQRLSGHSVSQSNPVAKRAHDLFEALITGAAMKHLALRARVWLHISAAFLALGGAVAMYARGWAHEYRAVWESTLLSESSAKVFFKGLFGPASALTGVEMPLDELPDMHRRVDQAAKNPGEGRPWIHLYAATLFLYVIFPRLLLIWLESWKSAGIAKAELRSPEWVQYARRLMSFAAVGNAAAQVLVLGLEPDETSQARWRSWLRGRGADIGQLHLKPVRVGDEEEFVEKWDPPFEPVMLVINAALTPEEEVHRTMVGDLVQKLESNQAAAPLIVSVDDTELRKRWAGFADCADRLKTRTLSWRETLRGLTVDWI